MPESLRLINRWADRGAIVLVRSQASRLAKYVAAHNMR